MNYRKLYEAIISRSRERCALNQDSPNLKFEKHHIIPRSFGGSDDPSNIAKVTPREHFILHLLLVKMTSGVQRSKMAAAMILMIRNTNKRLGRQHVTSRVYDASRFWKTAEFSAEHRRKLSEAAKRRDPATRIPTLETRDRVSKSMSGKTRTAEHQRKLNESCRGERESWGRHSEETKAKFSALHKGKPKSEEHKRKLSEAKTGKKLPGWSDERRARFAATMAARISQGGGH